MFKLVLISVMGIALIPKNLFSEEPEKGVKEIHEKILTVDTHVDTPMNMLNEEFDVGERHSPPESRVDFPRMKEGGLDAIFFAAFTGQRERTRKNTRAAYKRAYQMIEATRAACETYPELASIALSADDASKIEAEGKRAVYIGMENGFPLGTKLKRVKEFYDEGVRYITLCHSSNNDICDSSTDRNGPEHDGLSKFGKRVVKKMNKLGMLIDVSHISDKSFYDVIEHSKAPVFASHSSVRSIAQNNRNLSDDMIKTLAENNGVIQICLLDAFIKNPDTTTVRYQKEQEFRNTYFAQWESLNDEEKNEVREKWHEFNETYPKELATVAEFVDHIDYVKNLVGIDYVGIGTDFDGGGGIDGCADVSELPNITAEMLARGYTEEEIRKVWGGNFFRVFAEVEKRAKN